MKKYLLILFLLPSLASAAITSWDFTSGILQPLQSAWSAQIKGSFFTATSTSNNTFPFLVFTAATGTRATTTNFYISNSLFFNGVSGTTWASFCTAITGGSTLCDGADADTTYTFGDALTLTAGDVDFDGGTSPSGDLGGTWATPSVDDDSHAHTSTSISGIDISADTNLAGDTEIVLTDDTLSIASTIARDSELSAAVTAGDGLTRTVDDIDCDIASGTIFGCLSSANWTTFNSKQDTITTGDALTLTGTDIDFDGGATPSGDLGGTWASPSVTDDSHAHTSTSISGLDVSADLNLTGGLGLTLTGDDMACDTADTSTFGCLTDTDWDTFNNKLGSMSFSWPFTKQASGEQATSTIMSFLAGFTSASSTFTGAITVVPMTSAILQTGAGGLVAEYAGTTCTNQFVRVLSALGIATCETVDISADTNLTAGDALTLTADDIDFDGGTAPGGELGGTWGTPTIDDSVSVTGWTLGDFLATNGTTTNFNLSGNLTFGSNYVNATTSPSFNVASTTLDAMGNSFSLGTTSLILANFPETRSLVSFWCIASSTGSVVVRFGDGVNWSQPGNCTTTGKQWLTTTNNTYDRFENFVVEIGTSATNPSRVTITPVMNKTSN